MHESEPDNKWQNDTTGEPPRDVDMAHLGVLMRIYDLQLALLSHFNSKQADEIFAAHAEGNYFNPPIYIPEFEFKAGE